MKRKRYFTTALNTLEREHPLYYSVKQYDVILVKWHTTFANTVISQLENAVYAQIVYAKQLHAVNTWVRVISDECIFWTKRYKSYAIDNVSAKHC